MLSSPFVWFAALATGLAGPFSGAARGAVAGQLEANFPSASFSAGRVYAICPQPDGRILLGGEISLPTANLARLNLDGSADTTFKPGAGPDLSVYSIATPADGAIVIGGAFQQVNQRTRRGIARLTASGSMDTNLAPVLDGTVLKVAVQPDGKILAGGDFKTVNGQTHPGFARFLPNGAPDTAFNQNTAKAAPSLNVVNDVAIQPDGRLVLAITYLDYTRSGVARVLPDGSLDVDFSAPKEISGTVKCLALQPDGKIVIGGTFRVVGGQSRNLIARLETDGRLDSTFLPGRGAEGASFPFVNGLAVEASGKIILVGGFTTVDGVKRLGTARLLPNGSLDPDLVADSQARNGAILDAVALQADGRVLIGGHLGSVDNQARPACARLAGTPVLRVSPPVGESRRVAVRGAVTPRTVLESSIDLVNWAPVATNATTGIETVFESGQGQGAAKGFFRAWRQEGP